MNIIDKVYAALAETDINFWYCAAPDKLSPPYGVYMDYYENYDKADNGIDDIFASVQVDYYTAVYDDGGKEAIRAALDEKGFTFDTQHFFESEQKLHHFVFDVTGARS